jgi:hypothetical protein
MARGTSLILLSAASLCCVGLAAAQDGPAGGGSNGRQPRVNYMLECQGCHLPDGSGMAGRVPALKGEVQKFLSVPGGREFLVQVPGSANSKLSNRDLADLLNWTLVTFGQARPGSFPPFSEGEVASLRRVKLSDIPRRRATLAAEFQAPDGSSTSRNTPR